MIVVVWLAWSALAALGTWTIGWWAVPLVAGAAGAFGQRPSLAAAGAALAWAALLGLDAASGRLAVLAALLGGLFPLPGPALVLVTLAFAALAAWSAATLARAARARAAAPRSQPVA